MAKILGISGSLRRGSDNTALLRAAGRLLPAGDELALYEGLRGLPPYDPGADLHPAVPVVADLRAAIAGADGVLIATPEYNGSTPGVLKNAVDWASRPFPDNSLRGKPVAVIGATEGLFGAVWAQADLRRVLGITGAEVIERELPVGQAHEAFNADGTLADGDLQELLASILAELSERSREREETPTLSPVGAALP